VNDSFAKDDLRSLLSNSVDSRTRRTDHLSMAQLGLDKSSPVPLYHQLAETLAELIRDGTLSAGDRLPPERDLSEMGGVSRMTARQAVAQLERAGDVVVRQGIGTFVAEPKLVYDAIHLQGFTEASGISDTIVSTKVIEQTVVQASPSVASKLRLSPNGKVVNIVRLRSVSASPLLLETSLLPEYRFADLAREDLENQSLYWLLEHRFNVRFTHARESVEAALAGERDGPLLGITPESPILVVTGTVFQSNEPIEWFQAVYRADRVKLAVDSQRQRGLARGRVSEADAPRVSMVLS